MDAALVEGLAVDDLLLEGREKREDYCVEADVDAENVARRTLGRTVKVVTEAAETLGENSHIPYGTTGQETSPVTAPLPRAYSVPASINKAARRQV